MRHKLGMGFDQELEDFKRQIDLRQFAADMGYAVDRRESWRGSAVMRDGRGDKIVIKLGTDGHYVYFSVRDDNDNGSIIDFVQRRKGLSLGLVRKELRAWAGRPDASLPFTLPKLLPTTKDRQLVEQRFQKMKAAPRHPYLEVDRKIPPALLASQRIAGRVKIDDKGNAVFPHFDAGGLCGYELKNRGFTGFASGGEKGLWMSHATPDDRCLVIAESGIDALSYAALFPNVTARYGSIGGKLNPVQPTLIKSAILRMPPDSEIVSATDNDKDGRELASMIEAAVQESGRDDLAYRLHVPALAGQDWNDILKQNYQPSFPTAHL